MSEVPHMLDIAWYWCLNLNWLWADSLFRFSWFNNTDEDDKINSEQIILCSCVLAPCIRSFLQSHWCFLHPHSPFWHPKRSLSLSLDTHTHTHTHQNIFLATTHAKVWTENKTPCVSWQYIRIKLRQANSKVIRKRMSLWLDILIMWATRYEIFSIYPLRTGVYSPS